MAMWVNRTAGLSPAPGAATRTINFTPAAAGNFLVIICGAPVTTAWPVGWTEQQTPVNFVEISVATKTATAGESSVVVTNNANTYSLHYVAYEFAAGSSWVAGASASGAINVALPALAGLPGTAVSVFYIVCGTYDAGQTVTGLAHAWSGSAIEDYDADSGASTTSDSFMTVAYTDGVTATTAPATTATVTSSLNAGIAGDATTGVTRVTFAITAAALLSSPTVDALGDRYLALGATLERTAIVAANGATVTAQGWSLISGTGSPATLSSTADLSWTPTSLGTYGLRFSATNSQGTTTQDITVTVVDGVWHKDAMIDMYRMGRF